MTAIDQAWGGSLHDTFRIMPAKSRAKHLRPFLEADGLTPSELLTRLPYDSARAKDVDNNEPDARRYRAFKQVYQSVGLLYEEDGVVHVTELGRATLRWLDIITPKNRVILSRHAAYALAACQLREPSRAGMKYPETVQVFPFAFIWRAMLALDGRISSDELNRGLFKVTQISELEDCVSLIRRSREMDDVTILGDETVEGTKKNDRIIPWVSLASFGWTLFADKGTESYYELDSVTLPILREASKIVHKHQDFGSVRAYVEHVSRCAALPRDLR